MSDSSTQRHTRPSSSPRARSYRLGICLAFICGYCISSIISSLGLTSSLGQQQLQLALTDIYLGEGNRAVLKKDQNSNDAVPVDKVTELGTNQSVAVDGDDHSDSGDDDDDDDEVEFDETFHYLRYHEMPAEEFAKGRATYSMTSYSEATVVERSPNWFPMKHVGDLPRREKEYCTPTCCATPVAISLAQDDKRIINTADGLDLADVLLQHYRSPKHLEFFAPILTPSLLPCLQSGVIIHMDNHGKNYKYFFEHLRPNITVPYGLITSESDANSPYRYGERIGTDVFLLRWYGQSVFLPNVPAKQDKIVPFPLGLSKYHAQDWYLTRYLELRKYVNPFKGSTQKQRWIDGAGSLDLGKTVDEKETELRDALFLKYSITPMSHPMRQQMFDQLCRKNSTYTPRDNVSCQNTVITPHEIYAAASTYLFGLSPHGVGWDCYRTYELLLMGVIPIVLGREGGTHGLFQDLPVLELPLDWNFATTQPHDYLTLMQEYVNSPAFLDNEFDLGWERLFLPYWRRRIIHDLGRDKDIVKDEFGREFFKTWRYGPNPGPPTLCGENDNCIG